MCDTAKGVTLEPFSTEEKRPSFEEVKSAVRALLLWIGEDPNREGLLDTPERVVKAYQELFTGYNQSVEDILETVFEEVSGYNESVIVKDIPFYSHCEHHMIPIVGKVHIAYIPETKIIGLSKIARIVDVFSRRLQTQEAMTAQIADALNINLKPRGVAVLIEAEHMCMVMRGIKKQGTATITTNFHGYYKLDQVAQANFMTMVCR
ncbi:GTP cyclohydrolase I FolE [Bartonella sp. B41]